MKKYILVALVLVLLVAWFVNNVPVEKTKENTMQSATSSQTSSLIISSPSSTSQSNSISTLNQSSATSSVWEYQEPIEEKIWRNSRGIFNKEELIEYGGFKLDKLEELANNGDLKAIETLRAYERASGNVKRYEELTYLGVIHGSLASLRGLSTEKIGNYLTNRSEENLLEMFAYKDFQAERGDLFIKSKIPVDYKIYDFYPTLEQAEYIDRRSDELMADFERRRKELGLPPFDNSTLESDRKMYEDIDSARR